MQKLAIIIVIFIGVLITLIAIWWLIESTFYILHPTNTMPGPIAEMVCLFVDIALFVATIIEVFLISLLYVLSWIPQQQWKWGIYLFGAIALLNLPLILILYKRVYG